MIYWKVTNNESKEYVVIAKGALQGYGSSLDEIKNIAMNANHRFVFKVERKEKSTRKFRWPTKRKA